METVQRNILIIAIIVFVIAILLAIYELIKFYKSELFICPNCGYSWKPPVLIMLITTNAVDGKIIRCPKCGSKKYIEPSKDKY